MTNNEIGMTNEQTTVAVIEARGVTKTYPSGDRTLGVLSGIDLLVTAGESVSIRGESGSGKSTLLNLLAGLDAPDAGEIRWAGEPRLTTRARGRSVGLVFQSFYLMPELTARDNVLMAARVLGRVGAAERARAEALLAEVGLADRAGHVPAHLSGGERQRVALARALMNRPALLLADEPTGNLDERSGDAVIDLLMALGAAGGTALVLVTHNAAHAARTQRQLLLRDGRLVSGVATGG